MGSCWYTVDGQPGIGSIEMTSVLGTTPAEQLEMGWEKSCDYGMEIKGFDLPGRSYIREQFRNTINDPTSQPTGADMATWVVSLITEEAFTTAIDPPAEGESCLGRNFIQEATKELWDSDGGTDPDTAQTDDDKDMA